MVGTLLLLLVAATLGLYALRELAPQAWASAMGALRRLTVAGGAPVAAAPPPRAVAETGAWGDAAAHRYAGVLAVAAPAAVVVLALALRVVDLTGSPFGFFCDEASNGLDAYWLAHTLRDQHGAFLPAYFYALSDWRGGFHIYWEVPFVALFGLTEFAVRLGSAVAGTVTVWLVYLFVSKAMNRPTGLIAAVLLATSPWHLMQSRVAWEEISLPFVTALCLTFLFVGLERPRWLPLAFVFGALGMYTYQPGRVFFPLFCLAWIAIYAVPLWCRLRASLIGVAGAVIVLIPTILSMLDGTFFARLNQVSTGPAQTVSQRVATFWANYQAHFSWHFLFESMTPEEWITRHFVRGYGMLYTVEAPFLIIGVLGMLACLVLPGRAQAGASRGGAGLWPTGGRRAALLFLAWFLIYPVAASLIQTPVSHRSIAGVLVFQVAVAWGVYLTCHAVGLLAKGLVALRPYRRAVVGAAAGVLLVAELGATAGFMNAYLTQYPLYSAGWDGWQWGAGPAVQYFMQHRADYDHQFLDVVFNAPDELMRFYVTPTMPTCATCMAQDFTTACNCTTVDAANPADWQAKDVATQRELWVVTPDHLARMSFKSGPYHVVHTLTYPNGATAFVFVATGPHASAGRPRSRGHAA